MMRVLLVERDSLQRELISEWLRESGVQILTEATAHGAEVDAILIDVTCQQQAHETLASWRSAHPRAAIVLASGRFSRSDMANDAMAARLGVTRILAKPFTRKDLWAALNLRTTCPSSPGRPV
ncbi:MAG: response regulator [Proteobacteria bacterium]|nr:response regulator [Pseudomonadota bacterium]